MEMVVVGLSKRGVLIEWGFAFLVTRGVLIILQRE
jgi:hypothetical protein